MLLSKTDTVTVTTVPLGMQEWNATQSFSIYPNPSNGVFTITPTNVIPTKEGSVHAAVYDLLGRKVFRQELSFNTNNTAEIQVNATQGAYMLELSDAAGNTAHQRIVIE